MIELIAISSIAMFFIILIAYVMLNAKITSAQNQVNGQLKFLEKQIMGVRRGMQDEFIDRGAFEVEKGDLDYKFNTLQSNIAKMREKLVQTKDTQKMDGRQVREASRTLKRLEKKLERLETRKKTGLPKKTKAARKKKITKSRTKKKKK